MSYKKSLEFRARKAIQVWKHSGSKELIFRILRTLYRRSPLGVRKRFSKLYYQFRGYKAVGDPFRVFEVNPNCIEFKLSKKELGFIFTDFCIKGGSWDQKAKSIEDSSSLYKAMEQRFNQGKNWEDTERYKKMTKKIEQKGKIGSLDKPEQSKEDYINYLDYLDALYSEIKENGYKSQEEVKRSDDFAFRKVIPPLNEIQLMVGRDGSLICESGIHRLCISKILEIDKVSVRVMARHKKWQEIREDIKSASSRSEVSEKSDRHINHPELQDIVSEDWKN